MTLARAADFTTDSRPGGDAARPCFIHIGAHKTGTTSIQAFLAANRERFARRGIAVPFAAGTGEDDFACHHGIVAHLLGAAPQTAGGGLDAVLAEVRASASPAVCLTSEDFSLLGNRPELLARLRDGVRAAGYAPCIVVYLRPQASYAVAIYAANVLSGYRGSFASFMRDIIGKGHYVWDGGHGPPFDYERLLDAFAAIFGPRAVIARRFRSDAPDTALLASFCAVLLDGDDRLDGFAVPPRRANRTLTFAAVLRVLGQPAAVDEHVRFAPMRVRDLVRLWLRFRRSNRRLAKAYGVRIPVLEPLDVARALPLRKTPARTRMLLEARAALRRFRGTP